MNIEALFLYVFRDESVYDYNIVYETVYDTPVYRKYFYKIHALYD